MTLEELEDALLALDYTGEAVKCAECGHRKNPRGRCSGMVDRYLCDPDCPGYDSDPHVGSLHPGERASDYGYEYLSFDGSRRLWQIIRGIRERRTNDGICRT